MSSALTSDPSDRSLRRARARAKVLAREDRLMKAELIRLRQQAGLTQKHVADLIGVSQQAINKLERYDSDPKMSTIRRYANAIGAIVEHSVAPDVGQSEWLAFSSPWESVVDLPSAVLRPQPSVHTTSRSVWSDSKRADFALVG